MLQSIFNIAGLIILVAVASATLKILSELKSDRRNTDISLLFSKLDKSNLQTGNIRDKLNSLPDRDSVTNHLVRKEKTYAQLLASIEGVREILTTLAAQMDTIVQKAAYADYLPKIGDQLQNIANFADNCRQDLSVYLPKIDETTREIDGQLQNIADFADCGRKDLAVLKDIAESVIYPKAIPEELVAEAADTSSADEASDTNRLTKEQADAVAEVAEKYVTVDEKYERMKQRRAEGADWKVLAKEFGYTCPRNARRFFTQQAKKEKATQE